MYPESRKTFYFDDEFDKDHGVNMVIRIKHNKMKTCYIIDYKYLYRCSKDCHKCKVCSPLFEKLDSENGDIIKQNSMTDEMILYMMMSDDELINYSGHSTTQHYRRNIIQSLSLFWD